MNLENTFDIYMYFLFNILFLPITGNRHGSQIHSGGKIFQLGNHQSPDSSHAITSSPQVSRPKLDFPGNSASRLGLFSLLHIHYNMDIDLTK